MTGLSTGCDPSPENTIDRDGGRGPTITVTSSDGARIALHDLGGDGPPLLMVHATGMHGMLWKPVADALHGHFRCWAPDLRGHGDSTPPPAPPHDWLGFRRDIVAVVDHLGMWGGLAVGHSMGGANLMATAATHPGIFGALWVFEPAVAMEAPPVDGPSNESVVIASRRRPVFPSKQAAIDRYGSRPPMDCYTPEALEIYVDHGFRELDDGTVQLKCLPEVEAGVFDGFRRSGVDRLLFDVDCPVFVAGGVNPDRTGRSMGASMVERLPHGVEVELPGVNHFAPMQKPDVVARSILECFGRLG
jgi:pimeloyl-ACP methyl ester carboxylesterase